MKKNIIFFLISIYLTSCETIENYDIAIQNVTIFQSQEKITLKNKTILIKNDTIAAIVDANQKISAKQIIQGNERLVTSGFIDTHVHLRQMLDLADKNPPSLIDDTYRKKLSEKALSFGTTTILDMGQPEGWIPVTINWQKKTFSKLSKLFYYWSCNDFERK